MLTYHLETSKEPMYLQLYRQIKEDIHTGVIQADEKLPSKRKLAEHLGISLITVENAYAQLIIEGYLYTVEKKGYYAAAITKIVSLPAQDLPQKEEQPAAKPFLYDLAANSVLADAFPFDTWAKLTRRVLSERSETLLRRTGAKGFRELREAIAAHLHTTLGMQVTSEQIVIGSGTEYMYGQLIQMLGFQKTYGYEVPGHHSIHRVYNAYGVPSVPLEMDEKGVTPSSLKQHSIDVLHISAAHHFPTGITMPISRRHELLAWAQKNNAVIIEDDYDSEFRMQGKPIPPLFSLDRQGCVIYMNTFSKTLSPSFRISYMVLPASLLEQYNRTIGFYATPVSSFEQIVLARFLSEGYFERHLNRTRHEYRTIRNTLLEEMTPLIRKHNLKIKEENAGLHFLIEHPYAISDAKIKTEAEHLRLHIAMLSDYYPEPFDSHTMIMNYSGLPLAEIPKIVQVLSELMDHIKEGLTPS